MGCPNCGNPMEKVQDEPRPKYVCGHCGAIVWGDYQELVKKSQSEEDNDGRSV